MNEQLRKAQLLQWELALEIKRICELHHIPYFMIAGTLLGAVRHQGFIPWDDDMDVGMLREDYEQFLLACKDELGDRFFLQTWDTDRGYGLPFAKLRLNGTKYVEQGSANVNAHNGIYVDVFPFDSVPADTNLQKRQNRRTYLIKRLILAKNGYEVWQEGQTAKQLIYGLLSIGAHVLPLRWLKRRLDNEMMRYNGQHTEKIVAFGGSYGYWKESIRREWAENRTELSFESGSLSAPADYDGYLRYFYGDYMTPPPEDKRGDRHQIVNIDFGGY